MRSNARLRGAVAATLGAAALSVPAFAGCGGGARQRDPHRREPRGGRALPRGTPQSCEAHRRAMGRHDLPQWQGEQHRLLTN